MADQEKELNSEWTVVERERERESANALNIKVGGGCLRTQVIFK